MDTGFFLLVVMGMCALGVAFCEGVILGLTLADREHARQMQAEGATKTEGVQ